MNTRSAFRITFQSLLICFALPCAADDRQRLLHEESKEILVIPQISAGLPSAGRRTRVRAPEYAEVDVFHTVYLPPQWVEGGSKLPIIFELTGNYYPAAGSTGEVTEAGLGYGLSGGKYIWVVLPFISKNGTKNETVWWGDAEATTSYARTNTPRIIAKYNADANAVFFCGFSRGAIGVNFIGLGDDEIAKLWTAFITHDHFDGVREWKNTEWGTPLDSYRRRAAERLNRVRGRPYLVCQHGSIDESRDFVSSVLPVADNFTFLPIDTQAILGVFPNEYAKASHNDRWLLKPSKYRSRVWKWMNRVNELTDR